MTIAPAEQEKLISFVKSGKGLYVEGAGVASYNSMGFPDETEELDAESLGAASPNEAGLLSMLGCSLAGYGAPRTSGNVDSLSGVPGTIGAGFRFGYLSRQGPDDYVDEIAPAAGAGDHESDLGGLRSAGIFESQNGKTRVVCHAGPNYTAICSSVIFSALRGTDQELEKLAGTYVRFLSPGWTWGSEAEPIR